MYAESERMGLNLFYMEHIARGMVLGVFIYGRLKDSPVGQMLMFNSLGRLLKRIVFILIGL